MSYENDIKSSILELECGGISRQDNAINNYGQDMYNRGVAGGKSLGVSLLHLELLKHGLGTDGKFLEVLNNLRAEFDRELNKTLESK